MLKIKKVQSTVYDYLELKDIEPFKSRRSLGKTVNFTLLFGASAQTFAQKLEIDVFTDQALEDFIRDVGLQKQVQEIINKRPGFPEKKAKFLASAEFIRESFFNSYKGLRTRLTRELEFGKEHGYVRSWHGPIRGLFALSYMRFDDRGNLYGLDKANFSKLFSNLKNDAGNSTIQTLESGITQRSIVEAVHYLKKWGFKSRIWNQVHDSADWFVYVGEHENDPKDETGVVLALTRYCDVKERFPFFQVPMDTDAEIADVSSPELVANGNYYHKGKSVNYDDYDLQTELDKYNKLNGTNHSYVDLGEGLNWKI